MTRGVRETIRAGAALSALLAAFGGCHGFTGASAGSARERSPSSRPPRIVRPVMFDTPEADRILSAMQIFPPDNPWNRDVSALPVNPRSKAIVASIGADEHFDYNLDMNFVLVPPDFP